MATNLAYEADGWQLLVGVSEAVDPADLPADLGELLPTVCYRIDFVLEPIGAAGEAVTDIAAHLLGEPNTGLLTDRLRTELGWSYDVRCHVDDLGPWRVLMCKAVVARHNAGRVGAEMRAIAALNWCDTLRHPVCWKKLARPSPHPGCSSTPARPYGPATWSNRSPPG